MQEQPLPPGNAGKQRVISSGPASAASCLQGPWRAQGWERASSLHSSSWCWDSQPLSEPPTIPEDSEVMSVTLVPQLDDTGMLYYTHELLEVDIPRHCLSSASQDIHREPGLIQALAPNCKMIGEIYADLELK